MKSNLVMICVYFHSHKYVSIYHALEIFVWNRMICYSNLKALLYITIISSQGTKLEQVEKLMNKIFLFQRLEYARKQNSKKFFALNIVIQLGEQQKFHENLFTRIFVFVCRRFPKNVQSSFLADVGYSDNTDVLVVHVLQPRFVIGS